jgi:branched-subunit amino acid transport protein
MTEVWVTIGVLAVITAVFKATGPVLVGGRELPARAAAVIALAAPAVLAALVVQETFSHAGELVLDARAAGMAGAAAALVARLPLIAVVTIAAAVTAGVRALA